MSYNLKTKILLTGGGSGGSVAPLLALTDELGHDKYEYLWIGTQTGPEKQMVVREKINFKSVAGGKLRRYFSLRTLIMPFLVFIGFIQSFFIILRFKPDWIITAGSFISVPVVWSGWLLRKKILVHQQDARPGLANKLMAPFARQITVAFEKSLADYGEKARWIGNPVRSNQLSVTSNQYFKLNKTLPVVLILGGGTGARFINNLVAESLRELTIICQIIHVTGKGKAVKKTPISAKNYYSYEFLNFEQLAEAYAKSDIVISRCGMSTLAELSYLAKPSIFIPMPDSHQVDNARVVEEFSAGFVLDQPVLEKTFFIKKIKKLLADKELRQQFSKNISAVIKKGASKKLAKIVSLH